MTPVTPPITPQSLPAAPPTGNRKPGKIIYAWTSPDYKNPDHAIRTIGPDGTGTSVLLNDRAVSYFNPAVSPDGTMLVFNETPPGGYSSSALLCYSLKEHELSRSTGSLSEPRWSPDGSRLLGKSGKDLLVLQNPDGTNQQPLKTGGITDCAWSPDGQALIYVELNDPCTLARVYRIAPADGAETRIGGKVGGLAAGSFKIAAHPAISPDGQRLAVLAGNSNRALVVLKLDGRDYPAAGRRAD